MLSTISGNLAILAGILLLVKKDPKYRVELAAIERIIKGEQPKYSEKSPCFHLFSFLWLVAQNVGIPHQVQTAKNIEQIVDQAIATGYYPALFYAVRMLNQ